MFRCVSFFKLSISFSHKTTRFKYKISTRDVFLDGKEPVEMNAGACPNFVRCNEFIDFESVKKYPTKCQRCDERITNKHYQQYKDIMLQTRMHLDSMKMASVACK